MRRLNSFRPLDKNDQNNLKIADCNLHNYMAYQPLGCTNDKTIAGGFNNLTGYGRDLVNL